MTQPHPFLSLREATRAFAGHSHAERYRLHYGELAFDHFLVAMSSRHWPDWPLGRRLTLRETLRLVRFWVREREALQRVHPQGRWDQGDAHLADAVVIRLAYLERRFNAAPVISGILTPTFWRYFLDKWADRSPPAVVREVAA